ncbi:sugar ABC transporter substrate-binding protein [Neobacillus sp. KR4-4]|uniref:sugar ABC transporter substrate-binding protein n=1 Tax=Neobacillus sp. KR4-4 TaxID=3344872 RepID=UPI0035C9BCC3
MLKKLFQSLFVGMLVLSVFLTGCSAINTGTSNQKATTKDKNKKIVVGFSIGTTKQERWQKEVDMAKKYAADHGFSLLVQSCEEDPNKQIQQVQNMLSQGIDALLISAQDGDSSGVVVKMAHDAGVPVVAYDRLVRNGDLDYYITFDNEKVGELQAKALVEKYPKGNYISILGGPEDNNAHLIKNGQEKVLKPYIDKGDIKIVTQQWSKGWDPTEAMKNTENGLTAANNNVVAVLASNDGTAGGAIQALQAQGLAGTVGVSGQDADIAALQRIVAGTQTSTVYKPTQILNSTAMELVYNLAKGDKKSVENMVSGNIQHGHVGKVDNGTKDVTTFLMDVTTVTKDNIMSTIIKDGFHKMDEVYKDVPKDQRPKQ